jgi:MoxR-like ATPase
MLTPVATGAPLIALIELAIRADRPVLLHGRHGIGKSEVFAQVANKLGIEFIVRDLSLMEPPDLVGIPQVGTDGKTHYAILTFLPDAGQGLLVFEELNRCPRYMQSPCLQLLTARQLTCLRAGSRVQRLTTLKMGIVPKNSIQPSCRASCA